MESNTEEEDKKEAIIKEEVETEDTTQVEDTHAPTLDEMIAGKSPQSRHYASQRLLTHATRSHRIPPLREHPRRRHACRSARSVRG